MLLLLHAIYHSLWYFHPYIQPSTIQWKCLCIHTKHLVYIQVKYFHWKMWCQKNEKRDYICSNAAYIALVFQFLLENRHAMYINIPSCIDVYSMSVPQSCLFHSCENVYMYIVKMFMYTYQALSVFTERCRNIGAKNGKTNCCIYTVLVFLLGHRHAMYINIPLYIDVLSESR